MAVIGELVAVLKLDGTSFNRGLNQATKGLTGLSNKLSIATAAMVGLATVGIVKATKAFIEFEDQMANVRKTTGATTEQLAVIGEGILEISRNTRTSISELQDIATIGGLIGIAAGDVVEFTEATNKAAVALSDEFSGGAEEVTRAIGTVAAQFRVFESHGIEDGIAGIGSAMNELGAAGLATAPFIAQYTARLGGIANVVNISIQDIMGMAAATEELGLNVEMSSTAMIRAFSEMAKGTEDFANAAGVDVAEFDRLFRKDAAAAMNVFLDEVGKSDQAIQILDELGLGGARVTTTLLSMAGRMDLVREKMDLSNVTMEEMVSLQKEYDIKNNTTAASMEKLRNKFDALMISAGEQLAPALLDVIDQLAPLVEEWTPKLAAFLRDDLVPAIKDGVKWLSETVTNIVEWIKNNPELVSTGLKVVGVLVAVNTALRVGMFLFGDLGRIALGAFNMMMGVAGFPAVQNAMFLFNQALLVPLSPILGFAAIAAVAVAAFVAIGIEIDKAIRAEERYQEAIQRRQAVQQMGMKKTARILNNLPELQGQGFTSAGDIMNLQKNMIRVGHQAGAEAIANVSAQGYATGGDMEAVRAGLAAVQGAQSAKQTAIQEEAARLAAKYIPGFAVGSAFVPDDMLAFLHRGEQVIPAGSSNQQNDNRTVNITVNPSPGMNPMQIGIAIRDQLLTI